MRLVTIPLVPSLATVVGAQSSRSVFTRTAWGILSGANPEGSAAGDISGDGWEDVVIANPTTRSLSILWNDQNGGFVQNSRK